MRPSMERCKLYPWALITKNGPRFHLEVVRHSPAVGTRERVVAQSSLEVEPA